MFANIKPLHSRDIFGKYAVLRFFCRVTALALTFLIAFQVVPAPVYAAAAVATHDAVASKIAAMKQEERSTEIMRDLRRKMASVKPADFVALSHAPEPALGPSIVDEVGHLARPVTASDAALWKAELTKEPNAGTLTRTQSDYFAQRLLWLGEYELAADRAPATAQDHFRAAFALTNNTDSYHGQSVYDIGLCKFYLHNFEACTDYYIHMLRVRPEPAGLDRSSFYFMYRHAGACNGYHQGNARLGIPEPPTLDPLCGVEALAASLKSLGVAYDKKTVLAQCPVSQEGNNLQELIDAGHKLGASVYAVSADKSGLEMMPKPAIAYIEQDHFVSVVRADSKGVGYLCSDCGAWPGGEVDLTWNQWSHMEPGIYGAVVKHGSAWDRFFQQLPKLKTDSQRAVNGKAMLASASLTGGTEVASLPGVNLQIGSVTQGLLHVSELVAHLSILSSNATFEGCGQPLDSLHCCLKCGTCPFAEEAAYAASQLLGLPMKPMIGGPSSGDPVNLATGEEEYTPDDDLSVYNPIGPSVSWGRIYNSLRSPSAEPLYEFQDFGQGWSQNYNIGVLDASVSATNPIGNYGAGVNKYIYLPNGGTIKFSASSAPSSTTPVVHCSVAPGFDYLVSWDYNIYNNTAYYVITMRDRSQYVTSPVSTQTGTSVLTEIIDRNGNAIHLNYSAPLLEQSPYSVARPLLSSITDSNNSPLLVINRAQDGTGAIVSVDDRYGRTIYYHVGFYANTNVPVRTSLQQNIYACDRVSQLVPTDTPNAPDRYHYGYTLVSNGEGSEETPKLASISVPNPTGSATLSTATIAYNPSTSQVASITDANGSTLTFTSVNSSGVPATGTNYEQVTITGANLPQAFSFTVSNDTDLATTSEAYSSGVTLEQLTYGDSANPDDPTTVEDANGNTWTTTYTSQGIGDVATVSSPRGTEITNTYNYSNFGLGELTQSQESYTPVGGGTTTYEAPTTYTYYEPSGLIKTVTGPRPGTIDSSSTVAAQAYYNSLGEVTQVVGPGNNAASTIVDTINYGSTPQIGEPLSVTDNLGHTSYATYDAQANVTSATDALGNTTYYGNTSGLGGYNIANQNVLVTYPATGQNGSGNSAETTTYLYPGGPATSIQAFNEAGTQIRQVTNLYGLEGELLTTEGSTQFASYHYDGLYRLTSITDGNGNVTSGYYNAQGYLDSVTYPGYAGPTPVFNSTTGTWSNVSGADSTRALSYDHVGDLVASQDGRGVVTTCTYDTEDNLSSVSYNTAGTSVAAQPSVSVSYDGFGRVASVSNGITQTTAGYTSGGTTYPGYDDNDSPLNVQTTYYSAGMALFSKAISFTYNPDGSKASTVTPAGTFSYGYDAAQRPTTVTNPFGETTNWSYLNNNWLAGQTLSNGATTSYTYNAMARMTQLVTKDGSENILSNFSATTYDGAGNRTSLTATIPSNTPYSGTTSYTYDNKDELSNETSTRSGGYTNTFGYDGAENPTTFRGVASQTFNSNNQRTGTGFAYDGDGNPTTYKGSSLTFDVNDRLTAVGSTLTAGYGADGLRAWKTDSNGTNYYLYDGDSVDPVCEMNSSGTVVATNTFGIDGLISRNTSSGSTFYAFDEQGTVAERLNSAGSCTSSSTSDAFGVVASSGSVSDPYGYEAQAGYCTDQSTGLCLTTFRYYDPGAGRFLNRDPIGFDGGINLYGYCRNSPTKYLDPSGKMVAIIAGLLGISGGLDLSGIGAPLGVAIGVVVVVGLGIIWLNHYGPGDTISTATTPGSVGLPQRGEYPFIPPKNWRPTMPLPNIDGNYPDRDGNIWHKGPNHNFPDEDCEWDVTNPKTGKHINVGGNSGTVKYPKKK